MKRKRPKAFSVTKAVKANARDRVGQPRPQRPIPAEPRDSRQTRRHKDTLGRLLTRED